MRRGVKVAIWSIAAFLFLGSGLMASIAWFDGGNNEVKVDVEGSVVEEYFHCGNGTSGDPFVITRPIHFFHLVEFFQRETKLSISETETADFGTDYLYFQVGYDINNDGDLEVYAYDDQGIYQKTYSTTLNMAYYSGSNALLPIGTNEIPFIGSFNGNASEGIIISNLNIQCAETFLDENDEEVSRVASDVGIFGYVADADADSNPTVIENAFFDNLMIDLTDIASSVSSSVTDVDHLSTHDEAHVGLIAGHVHTFTNYSSTAPTNASPLANVYVSNATVLGGPGVHCDYGYIGKVDSIDNQTSITVATAINGIGEDIAWGGSISSKDYTALGYTLNPTSSGSYTKEVTGSGGYKMVITASTNANPETNQAIYRLRDTSYVPLKFGSDGKAHNKNTGYLVGSNVGTGVNASPKISSYKLVNIGNALSNTAYTNMATTYSSANISYVDSNLEILTYYNSGWKRISDSHNSNHTTTNTQIRNYTKTSVDTIGFQKYNDSRNNLEKILKDQSFVHGIHFDNNQVSSSNLLTIPANTAVVNQKTYDTTYQVPKGSINFSLAEEGFINFFAGTYNSSQVDLNFFSLNQVFRSGGNISDIKKISQIYNNNNTAEGQPKYVYKYSNNTYSTGTRGSLVFDAATILEGNAPVVNMLYYFEIPVNEGEYAMGVAGSTQGAYMIYLDLGANGSITPTDKIKDASLFTQIDFQTDHFVINSCFNVAYIIPSGSDRDNFSIKISCSLPDLENNNPYTIYEVEIINNSGNPFTFSCLLMDDDPYETNYYHKYGITYNGARTEYTSSDTYIGQSGATTIAPVVTS